MSWIAAADVLVYDSIAHIGSDIRHLSIEGCRPGLGAGEGRPPAPARCGACLLQCGAFLSPHLAKSPQKFSTPLSGAGRGLGSNSLPAPWHRGVSAGAWRRRVPASGTSAVWSFLVAVWSHFVPTFGQKSTKVLHTALGRWAGPGASPRCPPPGTEGKPTTRYLHGEAGAGRAGEAAGRGVFPWHCLCYSPLSAPPYCRSCTLAHFARMMSYWNSLSTCWAFWLAWVSTDILVWLMIWPRE